MVTVIKAKRLIDGTGGAAVENPMIVIKDDRIDSIQTDQGWKPPEAAEVVDASEQTVLPGFIDGHLHLAWGTAAKPGWNAVVGNKERLFLWAVRSAERLLLDGITTARDCGGPGRIPFAIRDGIETGLVQGPRILIAGSVLTTTAGHCHFFGIEANNADQLRTGVRKMVQEGADFIKIMASGGTLTPMSNRRRAQYSAEELTAAVEDAHRLNKRVAVHGNATEGIRNAVKAGVDSIAHCNWLGIEEGTIEFDESVVEQMAEKQIYIDLNMDAAISPLISRDGRAQDWGEKTRWDLMRIMQKAGVNIYLTTDGIGPSEGEFTDLLVRMVAEGKATAREVIPLVTRVPARALGIDDRVGTVTPGKIADLMLLNGNPLEDIYALKRIETLYRSGTICMHRGKLVLPETAVFTMPG